jgi:GTPase SAR1 family protein
VLRGSHVIILAFNLNSLESFEQLEESLISDKDIFGNSRIIVVGTHSDLKHKVPQDLPLKLASRVGGKYVEVSVINNRGILTLWKYITESLQ